MIEPRLVTSTSCGPTQPARTVSPDIAACLQRNYALVQPMLQMPIERDARVHEAVPPFRPSCEL